MLCWVVSAIARASVAAAKRGRMPRAPATHRPSGRAPLPLTSACQEAVHLIHENHRRSFSLSNSEKSPHHLLSLSHPFRGKTGRRYTKKGAVGLACYCLRQFRQSSHKGSPHRLYRPLQVVSCRYPAGQKEATLAEESAHLHLTVRYEPNGSSELQPVNSSGRRAGRMTCKSHESVIQHEHTRNHTSSFSSSFASSKPDMSSHET